MNNTDRELLLLLKEIVDQQKEQAAVTQAYSTVIHSILQHHLSLDIIAGDFMMRMDNYVSATSPERLRAVNKHWHTILNTMTEELNRRKAESGD